MPLTHRRPRLASNRRRKTYRIWTPVGPALCSARTPNSPEQRPCVQRGQTGSKRAQHSPKVPLPPSQGVQDHFWTEKRVRRFGPEFGHYTILLSDTQASPHPGSVGSGGIRSSPHIPTRRDCLHSPCIIYTSFSNFLSSPYTPSGPNFLSWHYSPTSHGASGGI